MDGPYAFETKFVTADRNRAYENSFFPDHDMLNLQLTAYHLIPYVHGLGASLALSCLNLNNSKKKLYIVVLKT